MLALKEVQLENLFSVQVGIHDQKNVASNSPYYSSLSKSPLFVAPSLFADEASRM